MKIRDPMRFVANPEISSRIGCKSQSAPSALRLTALFAALASTPCLAEDANLAGAGVAATVGFRSKTLAKDTSFSFTFATAGDYDYQCSIHPNMKGKGIVKSAS